MFWGVEVKAGKPSAYVPPPTPMRLHLSVATLDEKAKIGERVFVKCLAGKGADQDKELVICSLTAGRQDCVQLGIVFSEYAEFSVTGSSAVHLTGYYMPEFEGDDGDDDGDEDEFGMEEEDSDEDSEEDSDEDSDEEGIPLFSHPEARGGKSSVVIEQLSDDEEAATKKQTKPTRKSLPAPAAKEEDDESDSDSEEEAVQLPKKRASADAKADKQAGTKKSAPSKETQPPAKKAKAEPPQPSTRTPTKTPEQQQPAASPKVATPSKPHVKKFPNGLEVHTTELGKPNGKEATPGKRVIMKYTGKLQQSGKVFDSTKGRGPFDFRLGVGEVIKGWDVGVKGMRVGDKRTLIIPPSMGYGREGVRGSIPPNATLVFDVELVAVK